MSYTLEQLSSDIRNALKADSGIGGKQAVCVKQIRQGERSDAEAGVLKECAT